MQPEFEKVELKINQSFYANHLKAARFPSPLHFHPEIEILLILEGTGTRIIGDASGRFAPGELVMIGSNVPHVWYSDRPSGNDLLKIPETIYIQFREEFPGEMFMNLPEFKNINKLFALSKRGIRLHGDSRKRVADLLISIIQAEGFLRILKLLDILQIVAESHEYEFLASPDLQNHINIKNSEKLNKIYKYMLNNYHENITLHDMAYVANLSTSAFCRYFKRITNKTFIQFLNEIRIGQACKILQEEENNSISQICYECGFNNVSYFINCFKKTTGLTPLEYRNGAMNTPLAVDCKS